MKLVRRDVGVVKEYPERRNQFELEASGNFVLDNALVHECMTRPAARLFMIIDIAPPSNSSAQFNINLKLIFNV